MSKSKAFRSGRSTDEAYSGVKIATYDVNDSNGRLDLAALASARQTGRRLPSGAEIKIITVLTAAIIAAVG
jgi:hypothetical protein